VVGFTSSHFVHCFIVDIFYYDNKYMVDPVKNQV